jgi:uncharacterized protein
METLLLALGLVLSVEGLVFALAPARLDELLDRLREMPLEARRLAGLLALAVGVGLVLVSRMMGA